MGNVADNILIILDKREKRLNRVEDKIDEAFSRDDALSKALSHFTGLELDHYTEMKAAFPDNDAKGHRAYHEKIIKVAEAQEDFYNTMKKELMKKGFFWALVFLFGVLWMGFEVKIKTWLGL